MGKRLEITVVGSYHLVAGLVLKPQCIKTGLGIYGQAKWGELLGDIALGLASKAQVAEATAAVGDQLKPVYSMAGIGMQGTGFGMEVFHGGEFQPVATVDAKAQAPKPNQYMKSLRPGDMLGIFYARREGALFFRWDDVDEFDLSEICMIHEDATAMLGGKARVQAAVDFTYQGEKGRLRVADVVSGYVGRGYVFHKGK